MVPILALPLLPLALLFASLQAGGPAPEDVARRIEALRLELAASGLTMAGTGGVPPAIPLESPAPTLSPSAVEGGRGGDVVVRVLVRRDGRVGEAVMVTGDPGAEIEAAALAAARRWRFQPVSVAGKKIEAHELILFSFPRLEEEARDERMPGAAPAPVSPPHVTPSAPPPGDEIPGDAASQEIAAELRARLADRPASEIVDIHRRQAEGAKAKLPALVLHIEPQYPLAARRKALQARVGLVLHISAAGVVEDVVEVLTDVPGEGFEDAAIEAVRQWVYQPAELSGKRVDAYHVTVIAFRFGKQPA
jgi:TonB family protein